MVQIVDLGKKEFRIIPLGSFVNYITYPYERPDVGPNIEIREI